MFHNLSVSVASSPIQVNTHTHRIATFIIVALHYYHLQLRIQTPRHTCHKSARVGRGRRCRGEEQVLSEYPSTHQVSEVNYKAKVGASGEVQGVKGRPHTAPQECTRVSDGDEPRTSLINSGDSSGANTCCMEVGIPL